MIKTLILVGMLVLYFGILFPILQLNGAAHVFAALFAAAVFLAALVLTFGIIRDALGVDSFL